MLVTLAIILGILMFILSNFWIVILAFLALLIFF
jgi:hypothetical protein